MLELWKKQFTAERFSIKHHDPKVFILSQWQKDDTPSLVYLTYKWITTLFFIATWTLSIIDISHLNDPAVNRAKWLIYLTNWGFTACTIQSVLCTAMLTICYLDARSRGSEASLTGENHKVLQLYKVYWTANIIATDIAFGITIIYWALIYDETKMSLDGMNIIVHVFNSLLMLIDLCIVAHPIRLMHFYCPMICGACYIVFSIIYYLAGGTNKDGSIAIYPILNWSKPGITVLICVLVTLFIIFLHILTYCIYKARKAIHRSLVKIGKGTKDTSSQECEKEGCTNPVPVMSNEVV